MPIQTRYSTTLLRAKPCHNSRYILIFLSLRDRRANHGGGFSIVEILVSISIVLVAILATQGPLNYAISSLTKSGTNYSIQNLIDRDLAQLESIADRYVCSSSTCEVLDAVPQKSEYVSPNDAAAWNAFAARCTGDYSDGTDLITPLTTYIEDNLDSPNGLYRELSVNGSGSTSDQGIGRVKHFTVVYRKDNASGVVYRNSTIVPTVVSYCP